MTNGPAVSTPTAPSTREVFDQLGDHELAVVRALDRSDGLDEIGLASEARLKVSTAAEAAENLCRLALVERSVETDNRIRFHLVRDRLRQQIEGAPEALFSDSNV